MSMKNSNYIIGDWAHNFPASTAVSEPTAPQRAVVYYAPLTYVHPCASN